MKKFIGIFGCLLLVVALTIPAFATELEMTLSADKTVVKAGDVVTFTIAMPEQADCKSGGFNLEGNYDAEIFEFVGGDCLLEGTTLENVGYVGGKLSGSFAFGETTTVSGPIFNIRLKVKADAPAGKTTVAPTATVRNSNGTVATKINDLELNVVAVAMTLTADKTTAARGEVVTFAIATEELADCKAGGFSLDGFYDTEIFEFVTGDCPLDGTMLEKVGFTGGKLSGSFMLSKDTNVSGPIFTIQMKVKDTAAFGKTTVAPTVSARNGAGALETGINALEMEIVCAHAWGEGNVTTAATCEADGLCTYTCSICEESKTEVITMLGHKMDAGTVTIEPTCKTEGVKIFTCENGCGKTETETLAILPHTEKTEVTKEATCTAEGEKVTACTTCGEILSTEVIEKLGHAPETTVTKEPTYTADGEQVTVCTVCEGILSVETLERLPGSLDGNEAVDEDDVIYLLQHVLMPEDFAVDQPVNYDDNDTVDEDDVIYLLQHLLMPEDFPLR